MRIVCGVFEQVQTRRRRLNAIADRASEPERDRFGIPPLSRACSALHSSVACSLVIARRQARASGGRASSATARALLYLLHPCSRARLRCRHRFSTPHARRLPREGAHPLTRMRVGYLSKRASAALTHVCRFAHQSRPVPVCRARSRFVGSVLRRRTGLSEATRHNAGLRSGHLPVWRGMRHPCRMKSRARVFSIVCKWPPAHPALAKARRSCGALFKLLHVSRCALHVCAPSPACAAHGCASVASAGCAGATPKYTARHEVSASPSRAAAHALRVPLGNCSCVALPPASMQSCAQAGPAWASWLRSVPLGGAVMTQQ